MAKLNDLTSNKVQERKRQVRTYGTKTDLASTVVERGSTHWAEGSNVHIDGLLGVAGTATVSGTLRVSGLLDVTGTLNASGQINLSGSTAITGPLNVTGTTTISGNTNITGELNVTGPTTLDGVLDIGGDTTISGTLDIQGRTTIKNDLELLTGGIFKAGVTKIEPNGKATFGTFIIDPASPRLIQAPGGWLFSNGADDIGLAGSATSSVNLNSARAELVYGSTARVVARPSAIDLTAANTYVSDRLTVAGVSSFNGTINLNAASIWAVNLPVTSNPPNLHITSTGRIYKSSWTPTA